MKQSIHAAAAIVRRLLFLLAAVTAAFAGSALHAGGGPENYFLVVNSASPVSVTIANHYIALRQIPSSNVFYLEWNGDKHTTDVESFRERILKPILKEINERGLAAHIDGVVYSSDFPYSIDFKNDVPAKERPKLEPTMTPVGSINSLTYYYQYVLQNNPMYVNFQVASNGYFRPVQNGTELAETRGFRGWYGWGKNGQMLEVGGTRYLLSTMLGMTAGKGNSVEEVVSYLTRSAKADGSPPDGSVYFTKTGDPRSVPRHPWFDPAVAELKKLGVAAEVLENIDSPNGKKDIAGGMFGHANLGWAQRNNTILPGAIVDDLTSFGAEVKGNAGNQTLLTEFLRAGAAGSSGTAVEPLSNPLKFPIPYLFVHYARGCTLAEAFYQSVAAPYQLVIVGDPLCRPWAKIPTVTAASIKADGTLSGNVSIEPSASGGAAEVDRFQIFLDGAAIGHCAKGEKIELDTAKHSDGSHELRIVGIESGPIETQGRAILPVTFNNHDRTMKLAASARRVTLGQRVKVTAEAPGAVAISVYSNGRVLGEIKGAKGVLAIDTANLGSGPVALRAIGWGKSGAASCVLAAPVMLQIDPAR